MRAQRLDQHTRQHRYPVLLALAVAYQDLPVGKIDVLDPQAQTFDDPQPGTIQETRQQPARAHHAREKSGSLLLREYRGKPRRPGCALNAVEPAELLAQNLLVEKKQCGQRLVLGRGGHMTLDSEVAEKRRHFGLAHRRGMLLTGEEMKRLIQNT
jgi:hypothetical protein